jgi:bifunctional non-homologous end joining protein LigD
MAGDGRDLRGLPLVARKQFLREITPPPPTRMLYAAHVSGRDCELFQAACERDLEGIVAKRADRLYTP